MGKIEKGFLWGFSGKVSTAFALSFTLHKYAPLPKGFYGV
jgi:hypothetical protein